jgi:2-dehydro-3-deoxyphosphogluconate aldolase/(4S)-4-hydroxy-2-oxoglutarate aldolase
MSAHPETEVRSVLPIEAEHRVRAAGLLPVVALPRAEIAVPLGKALLRGGLDVIEITFRTGEAAAAIADLRDRLPEMLVGAGTVTSPEQAIAAAEAGALFGVAPGLNAGVVSAAADRSLPFWPGVATPTEIEAAVQAGCRFLKFFPAEAMGGVGTVRALLGPFRHLGVEFVPTGGIDADSARRYWAVPEVAAVGGSWITPATLLEEEAWDRIEALTRDALSVRDEVRA